VTALENPYFLRALMQVKAAVAGGANNVPIFPVPEIQREYTL
jgi:hypothetical protein